MERRLLDAGQVAARLDFLDVARSLVMSVAEIAHRYASHGRNMSSRFPTHHLLGKQPSRALTNHRRERCGRVTSVCVSRITYGVNFATAAVNSEYEQRGGLDCAHVQYFARVSPDGSAHDPMPGNGDTLRDVSVVIASVESARSIERCIDSIADAVRGTRSELVVVDASRDQSADIAERKLGREHVLRFPSGALTPELWAAGIARSTGRIVVLTTGHFDVKPTWIARLADGLASGQRGVAGRIDLAPETSITDWATYYLRYSEFVSEPERTRPVNGIPADNAAYDGEEIRRFVAASSDGFWEVEFHRQIHASGGSLALVNGAPARYGRSFPFRTILAHRFHHGRHSGAWRVENGDRSRLLVIGAAPLVPFVLAARVWRRVSGLPEHRHRFRRCLPVFLALAASWAAGECVGAVAGALVSRRPRFASA